MSALSLPAGDKNSWVFNRGLHSHHRCTCSILALIECSWFDFVFLNLLSLFIWNPLFKKGKLLIRTLKSTVSKSFPLLGFFPDLWAVWTCGLVVHNRTIKPHADWISLRKTVGKSMNAKRIPFSSVSVQLSS